MKDAKSPNRAAEQAEERRQQRDAPAYRLQQGVKEERHHDIAPGRHQVGRGA